MYKKILSLLIVLALLLASIVVLKFVLEDYLSNLFKKNIQIESFSLYPFKMGTSSLGGITKLTYNNDNFILTLQDVDLSTFEKINKTKKRKTMIVGSGKVYGDLLYNPFTNILQSNLHAKDITINGINLDRKLLFYNDVLGFNIVSLFRNYLKNLDKSNKITEISHLQFNATMNEGFITLDDVAFSSRNFRIALFGRVHHQGNITNFSAHLVDKNGCSIISQELTGNLKDPNIKKTKAFKRIVKTVPTSMFSTGMKMADFTKRNINNVLPGNKQHITKHILSKSDIIFKKTAEIVIPYQCKVVYIGKVSHPLGYKKGFI